MGIPRFYRYMSERYPLLNQPISDVSLLPEFDAFYLDMNGIVHNCTHSDAADDALNSLSLQGQLHGIFTYLDRLITHIIKPQQLLYIALDGVAPRAKLNQQRSRRFRAGLERQEVLEKEKYMQIKLEDEKEGGRPKIAASKFDSNCITPGTEFLSTLSQHLVYFVRQKMKSDPLWARLEVFFSGSEVPGEGEHKIVEFIRHRKMATDYTANMRHCMYGSDADLMLLGLMTHEPHFTLVRETVVWGNQHKKVAAKQIEEQQWQLVHLSLFREYLMMEMRVQPPLDGERMLDDFILLTFLLGNDFIPHSPTLEISEDAIPLLLKVYRELLETHKGSYLTCSGEITNLKLLQELFQVIGNQEEEILVNRAMEEKRRSGRRGGGRQAKQHPVNEVDVQKAILALRDDDDDDVPPPLMDDDEEEDEEEAERALLEALDGREETRLSLEIEKSEREVLMLVGSESFQDTKWNYYERKYGIKRGNGDAGNKELEQVKKHYMEALVWCLAYYFQGPPSWSWYYPYHYSPMISDLTDIEEVTAEIEFKDDIGPLLPFEQLMSNLPSTSSHLVPESYRFLMVSPLSPIKHFYPETFAIDMEGKRNAWEGVNLLPFIDVTLLKQAITQYCPDSKLTEAEKRRNKLQRLPVRIVRDMNVLDTLKSTLPGVVGFPDVLYCNTRVEDYQLPSIPKEADGKFQSKLMDGVVLPLAGFPSLYTVPLESTRIASIGLNCFGMSSRKSSFILQLPAPGKLNDGEKISDDEINPRELLGTTVLANWPNLHEVLVMGVSTLSGEYRLKQPSRKHANHGHIKSEVVFTPYSGDEKSAWAYYAQTEVVKLLSGRGIPGSGGIDLGRAGIVAVLHVLPLQGMVSNPLTGAIEKKFGETEAFVPVQLTVRNRKLLDARFEESGTLPLSVRFPVDSKALITSGKWLGCTAIVRSQDEEQHTVTVHVNTIDQEPPFGYVIAQQITDRFLPGYLVAQKLGISASTLGLITGSVIIKPSGTDIGLNIRYRKELLLPGYCRLVSRENSGSTSNGDVNVWRRGDIVKIAGSNESNDNAEGSRGPSPARNGNGTAWEYTERAVQLIAAFKKAFPEVVQSLSRLPFATTYQGREVFGIDDSERVEVKIEAVKQWIEQQHLGMGEHSKHIPITSEYVALNAVRAMEAAGTLRAKERAKAAEQQRRAPVVASVIAADLFRPNPLVNQDLTGHEISQRASLNQGAPHLGDRVINISARGVPFGHRGTVVATHVSSRCVEVLFDESFTGGEGLYGTTSLDRGKIVAWNNLLCVSLPPGITNRKSRKQNGNAQHANRVKSAMQRTSSNGVPAISTNNRVPKKLLTPSHMEKTPLVPPPIPNAMPPPPNPEKIQELIVKWSHNGGVASEGEKAPPAAPTSVAPTLPKQIATPTPPAATPIASEHKLAPSVAALFSAAEAASPAPPTPAADPVMGLFPHVYDQSAGASSLLAPPLPGGPAPPYMAPPPPMYYGGQPTAPGMAAQQPQLFVMPDGSVAPMYAPPLPASYLPQQQQAPMSPRKEEYPPLGSAPHPKTDKKPDSTTENSSTDAAKKKRHNSRGGRGKKTDSAATAPADDGKQAGAQKKWVPKQGGAKSASGPQLLMPSQIMRQQKPQQ